MSSIGTIADAPVAVRNSESARYPYRFVRLVPDLLLLLAIGYAGEFLDVLKFGGLSLGLVVIELIVAIGLMVVIGRFLNIGSKLTALLAVGSSICGVLPIIGPQGAIEADEKDSSHAIAASLALGALSLFTYPATAHGLHMSERAYGVWAGLSVDNTAEATAAGALYSDGAAKVAVFTKIRRRFRRIQVSC